jgi:cell division transport system ATP-binding protein
LAERREQRLKTLQKLDYMVEISAVTFTYRKGIEALYDIDLKVRSGEFVFIVGPTGCGKSTLLKLIYLEEYPTEGKIVVLGRDMTRPNRRLLPHIRRNLGIVFQDFQLLENKTVAENVTFALRVTQAREEDIERKVPLALKMVGLEERADSFPGELSGGEQQRTALARAIINNPPFLIADEPTGNLDPDTSLELIGLIKKINERGTTVLIATHDEIIVNAFKQRVVRLDSGRIISDTEGGGYRDASEELAVLPE